MSNIFIKPAMIEIDGEPFVALVRDPLTLEPLAQDGEWKVASQFWTRRLRDRDVVEAIASAAVVPASPPKPVSFALCENCVTPVACGAAARCVKAPVA